MLSAVDAHRLDVRATDGALLRLQRREDGGLEVSAAQAHVSGGRSTSLRLDADTAAVVDDWLSGGGDGGNDA